MDCTHEYGHCKRARENTPVSPPRTVTSLVATLLIGGSPSAWAQPEAALVCWVDTNPFDTPAPGSATDPDVIEITAEGLSVDEVTGADIFSRFEMRSGQRVLSAEQASYDRARGLLEVIGRVTYQDQNVTVYGEDARGDTRGEELRVGRGGFDMPQRPARGEAEEIMVHGDGRLSLASVFFTTCPVDRTDWRIRARTIELDVEEGFGRATGVRLDFMGVPILYAPRFSFPIDDRRKSGFLTPTFAERDRTGIEISVPYYLNLAPSYDMTLEPRYLSERGLKLDTEFRYLTQRSRGQIDFEYLHDDREFRDDRSYVSFQHETLLGRRWQVTAGIQDVSDDVFFSDLGTSLAVSSQTHLNRFVDVGFFAPWWSLLTRFQNFQTIDALIEDEDRPYERVPQMLFDGMWFGRLLAFESNAELVNFDRNIGTTGWRFDSTQELALRFARAGMFLTPAIALRQTNYWLDRREAGEPQSLSRTVPVASLDSGLHFERRVGAGGGWLQTLEPRMLYVRVPFRDQSDLPVFDTIEPDFNLVQLFRKSQFIGPDRITDTDQLSFGLTTRFIDPVTGRERLTATIGQTRYRSTQAVALPGRAPNDANASDYVAELGVGLRDAWNLSVGYQWNTVTESTARAETRFEYRPQADRLFGIGYRHRSGFLEQGDVSLVWPITQRWRAISRYSYSFLDSAPLEQFLGWEYESCCWRVRMVGRRYVSRRTGEFDSGISIQLELRGLSQRVTSPEELLDRGILGYRSIGGRNL
jgi:LPS-assembly protein